MVPWESQRRGFDAGDLASTQEEIASERELRSWWEQRSGDLATQATVNGFRWKRCGKQKWEFFSPETMIFHMKYHYCILLQGFPVFFVPKKNMI
jgi:hypothetical protein